MITAPGGQPGPDIVSEQTVMDFVKGQAKGYFTARWPLRNAQELVWSAVRNKGWHVFTRKRKVKIQVRVVYKKLKIGLA